MKTSFVFVTILVSALGGVPWLPEPQEQQDWMWFNWMERHQSYVNNSLTNGHNINILFYGDSITDGWWDAGRSVWDTVYSPLGAANYGVPSERVEHIIWRILSGEVKSLLPKICVLKIGTNNMDRNSEFDIARGIAALVTELRGRIPTTKILLLGILPRTDEATTNATERINSHISILDNGNTIRFLDMRDAYYNGNGQFHTDLYTDDLIHLSSLGYAKWNETMHPLILEMWNSA